MGRRLPSSEPTSSVASPLAHLPILAAFIALVVLSLVAALCASHHRKPSKSRLPQRSPAPPAISSSPDRTASPKSSLSRSETKTRESAAAAAAAAADEVVMTATTATHGPIPPIAVTPPANSRRKLSVSMSLKLADGLARVRTGRREAHPEKERSGATAAAAGEESVWMKTIILGEKCRVPSEHEEEEEEAAVYDENGNRRRNYHPRTPRSLPISRSNSFFNVEVFPS